MSDQTTCPRCGAVELVNGVCQSTGALHFRMLSVPFLTFHTADIAVRACMCASCGTVTLVGDLEKLHLLQNATSQLQAARQTTTVCT